MINWLMNLKYKSFEEKLFPPDLALSPIAAIKRFNQAVKIYGADNVLSERKFQKAREMWVGSVFLLAWSKMAKRICWVRPEYKNAPDVYGVFFDQHSKYKKADIQKIIHLEISDWRGNKTENIINRIAEKNSKNYPSYFWLIIHISALGESINPESIANDVSRLKPRMPVFLVSSDASRGINNYAVIGMPPYKLRFDFDLGRELLEDKQKPDAIKVIFGPGHEIDGLSILPLEFPKSS